MGIIKLTVAYEGTHYHGWQKQPDLLTVQGSIEQALFRLTGDCIPVHGAGRTDAGVHAQGQVAHFRWDRPFLARPWVRGINAFLPGDIAIQSAELAEDTFHARHSAKRKRYDYSIDCHTVRHPLRRAWAWHLPYPLETNAMQAAAQSVIGCHNFKAFAASDHEGDSYHVHVSGIHFTTESEHRLRITFLADRFLKYMARNLVGFLVEVGRGRRAVHEMREVLCSQDRRNAGPTAPPHGLVLVDVQYE